MILLFVAPMLVAAALVFGGWQPKATGNHGELVEPAEPVTELGVAGAEQWEPEAWRGRWQYLVTLPAGDCDADCREFIDVISRVREALHRDAERLRIRLVINGEVPSGLADEYSGVEWIRGSSEILAPLYDRGGEFAVHVVDPEGYRMLVHRDPVEPSDLLSDTRRLLRASDERQERALRP